MYRNSYNNEKVSYPVQVTKTIPTLQNMILQNVLNESAEEYD